WIFEGRLGIDLKMQLSTANEFRVAPALIAGSRFDPAILDFERLPRQTLHARDSRQQGLAGSGCCLADLHSAVLDRKAAPGNALVRRHSGVSLDHGDVIECYRQLLSGDLRDGSLQPRAQIDLA